MMFFLPFSSIPLTRFQHFSLSYSPISFLIASKNFILSGSLVASLKGAVSFPYYMFETRGLVKLGVFPGDAFDNSSCCISLAAKTFVYGII